MSTGIERRTFLGSGLALLAGAAGAENPPASLPQEADAPFWPPRERFALWPGPPPGAPAKPIVANWTMNGSPPNRQLWIRGVAMPEVHVFRAARPDGSALLAVPGGGYEFISVENEGIDTAERFNAEGTTVFVLTYRLPAEGWSNRSVVPLMDAQRAMRLLRSRAADLRIDPDRLGVIGFSAGGHLAADLAVSFDEPVYKPVDAADRFSARPAYAGLVYPVATLASFTHAGSRDNLLGPGASPQLAAARSPEKHVTGSTPPSFVVAAFDDTTVPIENSFAWIAACRKANTSIEAYLMAEGGHGFGFGLARDNPGSRWPDLFALWMRRHGG